MVERKREQYDIALVRITDSHVSPIRDLLGSAPSLPPPACFQFISFLTAHCLIRAMGSATLSSLGGPTVLIPFKLAVPNMRVVCWYLLGDVLQTLVKKLGIPRI
jgi:hypothetical protein